jgi:4-oxalmesaconate hydratase
MTRVIPADNILFASEMVGAVKGIDPETGNYFDDTRRYIDGSAILNAADKKKIFEINALKVYPRLAKQMERQGIAARA